MCSSCGPLVVSLCSKTSCTGCLYTLTCWTNATCSAVPIKLCWTPAAKLWRTFFSIILWTSRHVSEMNSFSTSRQAQQILSFCRFRTRSYFLKPTTVALVVCVSVCLSVCLQDNSKMNNRKVFKLGTGNVLGIAYRWCAFGVKRSKVTGYG